MEGRVVGVDIARFFALAGMMAIHILPAFQHGVVTSSQSLAGGRSSALFAVLAGASMSLATGARPVDPRRWDSVAGGILVRALLIALLGFWLGGLQSGIAVILVYYALLFVVGIPFLLLRTRTLFIVAGVWLLAGPAISHLVRPFLPPPSGRSPTLESLAHPATLVMELLFTGYYPVFVWITYLVVGLGLGRLTLREWRTQGVIGVVGAGLVVTAYGLSAFLLDLPGVRERLARTTGGTVESLQVELSSSLHGTTPTDSWWWLAVRSAHAGTPLDLLQTTGSALLMLAVCLAAGRLLPRVMSVVFGAGAMTLTLYTAHVWSRAPGRWDGDTMEVYVEQVAAALAVGLVFGFIRLRGPLEWLVSLASREVRRAPGEPFRWGVRSGYGRGD
jgi:hypothetical protein